MTFFLNLLRQAGADLGANKLRSALTILSLFVAVLSIMGIYTVSAVTRDVLLAQEEQRYGRGTTEVVTLSASAVRARSVRVLAASLAAAAAHGNGHYALVAEVPSSISVNGQNLPVQLTLTAGSLQQVRRLPVLAGAWYPDEGAVYQPLVVNTAAAKELGGVRRLTVQVGTHVAPVPAYVTGVIGDGSSTANFYSPIRSLLEWAPAAVAEVPCTLMLQAPGVAEQILQRSLMSVVLGSGTDASSVETTRGDTTATLAKSDTDSRRGFLLIAVASLVVSILGLLNVGLASVRERRREMAIRRATGTTRCHVFAMVCLSSCIEGAVAAAAALIVGLVAVDVVLPRHISVASAIHLPNFPWHAGVLAAAVGLTASLLGAAAPAVTAARADLSRLLK